MSIVFSSAALVIGNYLTATVTYLHTNPFMHVVFVTAPFGLASHAVLFLCKQRETSRLISLLIAIIVVFAFVVSWIPWFSRNPYESFVLMNVYFGPYGWMQWLWLFSTGLLPFLALVGKIRNKNSSSRLLATTTVLAYLHNAAYVLYVCHGTP